MLLYYINLFWNDFNGFMLNFPWLIFFIWCMFRIQEDFEKLVVVLQREHTINVFQFLRSNWSYFSCNQTFLYFTTIFIWNPPRSKREYNVKRSPEVIVWDQSAKNLCFGNVSQASITQSWGAATGHKVRNPGKFPVPMIVFYFDARCREIPRRNLFKWKKHSIIRTLNV